MKKSNIAAFAVFVGLFFFNQFANAALNAGVQAGFTQLQTDVLALIDLAWPPAIAITVAMIVLGMFKKVASKGAS